MPVEHGASGKRLAEIKIEEDASGSADDGIVTAKFETERTMVFNLDDPLPVSDKMQSTATMWVGFTKVEFHSTREDTSRYELASHPGAVYASSAV